MRLGPELVRLIYHDVILHRVYLVMLGLISADAQHRPGLATVD